MKRLIDVDPEIANAIRLETERQNTKLELIASENFPVSEALLENTIFEAGAAYLVHEPSHLGIIGGLRTYTLGPEITFNTAIGVATPIDDSQTSANGFVGLVLRPKLSAKWSVLTRADIGAGDANLTWSAEAGLGFRFTRWGGLAFGYKALGIDVEREDVAIREYEVVHHGPFFGLDFHWGR